MTRINCFLFKQVTLNLTLIPLKNNSIAHPLSTSSTIPYFLYYTTYLTNNFSSPIYRPCLVLETQYGFSFSDSHNTCKIWKLLSSYKMYHQKTNLWMDRQTEWILQWITSFEFSDPNDIFRSVSNSMFFNKELEYNKHCQMKTTMYIHQCDNLS